MTFGERGDTARVVAPTLRCVPNPAVGNRGGLESLQDYSSVIRSLLTELTGTA